MATELKCADLVQSECEKELGTLRNLWRTYCNDPDAYDEEEATNLCDYGLSFDYVEPGTFKDQDEGYFRYLISWGGPSDEFRIFANQNGNHSWSVYRVEYWYMGWFDGASVTLRGDDLEFMRELVGSFFGDSESMTAKYDEAMEV